MRPRPTAPPKKYGATNEKKCDATGKYRNVRGMFPEGRTYFAFFIETELGRCALRLRRNIWRHAGLVTPEAPGLVTPITTKAPGLVTP